MLNKDLLSDGGRAGWTSAEPVEVRRGLRGSDQPIRAERAGRLKCSRYTVWTCSEAQGKHRRGRVSCLGKHTRRSFGRYGARVGSALLFCLS